jgi:hypothetical protein
VSPVCLCHLPISISHPACPKTTATFVENKTCRHASSPHPLPCTDEQRRCHAEMRPSERATGRQLFPRVRRSLGGKRIGSQVSASRGHVRQAAPGLPSSIAVPFYYPTAVSIGAVGRFRAPVWHYDGGGAIDRRWRGGARCWPAGSRVACGAGPPSFAINRRSASG